MNYEPTTYLHSKENQSLYLDFLQQKEECPYLQTISLQFLNRVELTPFQEKHLLECFQCQNQARKAKEEHSFFESFYSKEEEKILVPEFPKSTKVFTGQKKDNDYQSVFLSFFHALKRKEFLLFLLGFLFCLYTIQEYYSI